MTIGERILQPRLVGRAVWLTARGIGATLRITVQEADPRYGCDHFDPCVIVGWHGRMFIPLYLMGRKGATILVSEHRDGEIVTAAMSAAGYSVIRGSTTHGGARALARLVRLARDGETIGITADGPQGPRWRFQSGAVYIAAKSGLPIIPVAGSASPSHYFRSWDTFQLPFPFARCVFMFDEPYYVPNDTSEEAIEFHRRVVEERLTALTLAADAYIGAVQP